MVPAPASWILYTHTHTHTHTHTQTALWEWGEFRKKNGSLPRPGLRQIPSFSEHGNGEGSSQHVSASCLPVTSQGWLCMQHLVALEWSWLRGTTLESRDPYWSGGVRAGVCSCRGRGRRGYCRQVDRTVSGAWWPALWVEGCHWNLRWEHRGWVRGPRPTATWSLARGVLPARKLPRYTDSKGLIDRQWEWL